MKTKLWAIGLVFLCTLFTSAAQIFYKFGVGDLRLDLSLFTNYPIIIGLILYGLGALILVVALRGGELSVLYPIVATSFIWVSIFSVFFLNETMNLFKWIGVIVIVFGVAFVTGGNGK